MNVLFIANDRLVFKEGESVRARMREYAALFGELHIIVRHPGGGDVVKDGPLTLYPVGGGTLLGFMHMIRAARRIIRAEGIEVVSAQDPFEQGFVAMRAVSGTDAKLHIQIHTDFLSPHFRGFLNRIRVFLADMTLPRADGIRVVSSRIAHSIKKRYGERLPEPSVIPITVRPELPEAIPLPPHEFRFAFLTIARLEKEKRIEDILRALADIPQEAGLIVVGDGSARGSLEALARMLGLSKRVVFTGWRRDSLALLRSADAYVQSSAYEGYGRTLIEAALASLPIITTDVGIAGDILRDGREALVVPVGNISALTDSMSRLVRDEALRSRLRVAAGKAAHEHLAAAGDLASRVCDDLERLI